MTATAPLLEAPLAHQLERLSFVTRRRLVGEGQGDRRSRRRGSSLEFADFRHYVAGDDPNRVDWNVYARTDGLFVRVYEEEEVLNLHLLLDLSRSMDWGEPNKLDYGRRLAAALAYTGLNASNRVSVWPLGSPGGPFGPAWGRARTGALLRHLESLQPDASAPNSDLDRALAAYRGRSAGLVILISDLLSSRWETALRRLSGPTETLVLHLLAPQELRPALGGDVRLVDRETGGSVPATLNDDALRQYSERLTRWRAEVAAFCARRGMVYVPVDSEVPLSVLLLDVLKRRGVLR